MVFLSKRGSFRLLGGFFITPSSAGSASNTMEQAGSMIISRKTMWTGRSTKGSWKITGMRDMPIMGM